VIPSKEFGVDFDKVLEPPRGSKMNMAKKKNPLKQPTKAEMVKAVVNLEEGMNKLFFSFTQIDDVLRQYIHFNKDIKKFQKFLDGTAKKRKEAAETAAASEHSGEQPESSGGNSKTSSE
tara:strand:+ start:282 stop:638 length:357 start_codon:yes stop_codon:yes gene_type:complete